MVPATFNGRCAALLIDLVCPLLRSEHADERLRISLRLDLAPSTPPTNQCSADLPQALRLGRVEVSCEGWSGPDDSNVLQVRRGSSHL
jgi:hypothetical protein